MDQLLQTRTNFAQVRDGRRSPVFYIDIDLSAARSIAAGTQLILPLSGNAMVIDLAPTNGYATVHIQDVNFDRAGAPIYMVPGYSAKVPFTQLLIENAAQPGFIFRIFYGVDIDFVPGTGATVQVNGSVNIIDNAKSRTINNQSYLSRAGSGAVALNNSHAQLYNPVGSGKNIILESFNLISTVAGTIATGIHNAQLTTNAAIPATDSKYSLGVANGMRFATQANIGALFVPQFSVSILANSPFTVNLREPVVLTPGFGYTVFHGTVNSDVFANFEYFTE